MGFSVTANSVLRNFYGTYRNLVKDQARQGASPSTLSTADSAALKKTIKALQTSVYSEEEDSTKTEGPAKTYGKKMKAFIDTYNYTLESSMKNKDSAIAKQAKKMKKLAEKYKYELSSAGISCDKDGFMKLSSSNKVTSTKRYEKVFGEKSSFMKELNAISGTIKRHINITL